MNETINPLADIADVEPMVVQSDADIAELMSMSPMDEMDQYLNTVGMKNLPDANVTLMRGICQTMEQLKTHIRREQVISECNKIEELITSIGGNKKICDRITQEMADECRDQKIKPESLDEEASRLAKMQNDLTQEVETLTEKVEKQRKDDPDSMKQAELLAADWLESYHKKENLQNEYDSLNSKFNKQVAETDLKGLSIQLNTQIVRKDVLINERQEGIRRMEQRIAEHETASAAIDGLNEQVALMEAGNSSLQSDYENLNRRTEAVKELQEAWKKLKAVGNDHDISIEENGKRKLTFAQGIHLEAFLAARQTLLETSGVGFEQEKAVLESMDFDMEHNPAPLNEIIAGMGDSVEKLCNSLEEKNTRIQEQPEQTVYRAVRQVRDKMQDTILTDQDLAAQKQTLASRKKDLQGMLADREEAKANLMGTVWELAEKLDIPQAAEQFQQLLGEPSETKPAPIGLNLNALQKAAEDKLQAEQAHIEETGKALEQASLDLNQKTKANHKCKVNVEDVAMLQDKQLKLHAAADRKARVNGLQEKGKYLRHYIRKHYEWSLAATDYHPDLRKTYHQELHNNLNQLTSLLQAPDRGENGPYTTMMTALQNAKDSLSGHSREVLLRLGDLKTAANAFLAANHGWKWGKEYQKLALRKEGAESIVRFCDFAINNKKLRTTGSEIKTPARLERIENANRIWTHDIQTLGYNGTAAEIRKQYIAHMINVEYQDQTKKIKRLMRSRKDLNAEKKAPEKAPEQSTKGKNGPSSKL